MSEVRFGALRARHKYGLGLSDRTDSDSHGACSKATAVGLCMILTVLAIAAGLVFFGSFAWDRVRKRRHRDLASRTQHGSNTLVDGVASPAAIEGGLAGGAQGNGSIGPF
jgi:hypothetical protein